VQTNIVIFDLTGTGLTSRQFVDRLNERAVLGGAVDAGRVRLVTHRDVSRAEVEHAVRTIGEVVGAGF
jgi:threonine aldolase